MIFRNLNNLFPGNYCDSTLPRGVYLTVVLIFVIGVPKVDFQKHVIYPPFLKSPNLRLQNFEKLREVMEAENSK